LQSHPGCLQINPRPLQGHSCRLQVNNHSAQINSKLGIFRTVPGKYLCSVRVTRQRAHCVSEQNKKVDSNIPKIGFFGPTCDLTRVSFPPSLAGGRCLCWPQLSGPSARQVEAIS
jgi:hypothetical protein